MRRFILSCAAFLCSVLLSAQEIRSINIRVTIDALGNAVVEQEWDVQVVQGSEWYIPIGNLGKMQVGGLRVCENGRPFADDGRDWDSGRSMAEKAGRSGIIDKGSDGVELCWGLGSHGSHKWTVSYELSGLVQSLRDYDAFNFMFVNPGMVAPPRRVDLTFRKSSGEAFSSDDTRFWFFGTEGFSDIREDGSIHFATVRPMKGNESVIAMMRFDKGLFAPVISRSMKFEKMRKKAFRGSSYSDGFDSLGEFIVVLLVMLAVFGAGLVMVVLFVRDLILKATGKVWSPKVFGAAKIEGWEREAPFDGSIPAAASLLKDGSRLSFKGDNTGKIIGAYFLKWINSGVAAPVKSRNGRYDLSFVLDKPHFSDECEASLYEKVVEAAGPNRILERGEFDKWASKHYQSLTDWPGSVLFRGREIVMSTLHNYRDEAAKLLKFKNFLSDFTLSEERGVPEVSLWGEYLVFAQLFGIADKVAEGFARLYPEEFAQYSESLGMDPVTMSRVLYSWSVMASNAFNAANAAKSGSSGGFGGGSSIGGGGGFSGGGFGGGSR